MSFSSKAVGLEYAPTGVSKPWDLTRVACEGNKWDNGAKLERERLRECGPFGRRTTEFASKV
ncbi:hypothetical protein CCACVL1_04580 [Corchorus capsularis]|uniref:Uncharacterized protein n=1 Tax=Corchorus capsularis TaxID=210143 RepID=A0A1R3JRE3_COCAP|nr:hypothetical protein CCACVL1_04580 [Corchorus capsularis]